MSKLVALVLLIAFIAQTFEGTFMVMDYYAGSSTFLQNCENKYRPYMHCNGKCVLMKKLRDKEKREQQQPDQKQENKLQMFSSRGCVAPVPASPEALITSYVVTTNDYTLLSQPRSIFHPPGA